MFGTMQVSNIGGVFMTVIELKMKKTGYSSKKLVIHPKNDTNKINVL